MKTTEFEYWFPPEGWEETRSLSTAAYIRENIFEWVDDTIRERCSCASAADEVCREVKKDLDENYKVTIILSKKEEDE